LFAVAFLFGFILRSAKKLEEGLSES